MYLSPFLSFLLGVFCGEQFDEKLEQWPHLSELVLCYTTDWVKDENKYGHYDSIGSVSFQNQIYEGPDTDIETGNYSFFNYDKCCCICSKWTCQFSVYLTLNKSYLYLYCDEQIKGSLKCTEAIH